MPVSEAGLHGGAKSMAGIPTIQQYGAPSVFPVAFPGIVDSHLIPCHQFYHHVQCLREADEYD